MVNVNPAAVMARHEPRESIAEDGTAFWLCEECDMFGLTRGCLPYRLAEALAASNRERDEARARAVMLRSIVDNMAAALEWLPYDDCLVTYDQPEQAS